MAVPENDIMTMKELAEYLRLKPQTIYTWAQEKKIPAAKLKLGLCQGNSCIQKKTTFFLLSSKIGIKSVLQSKLFITFAKKLIEKQ